MVKLVVADALKTHGRSRARSPMADAGFRHLLRSREHSLCRRRDGVNTIDANGVVKKIGTLRRTPSNWCATRATATGQYYLASEPITQPASLFFGEEFDSSP